MDGCARVEASGVRMIRNGLLDWSVMRPAASRVPRRPPPPLPDDPAGLSRAAVEAARARGFVAAGVLAASRPVSFERYRAWLEQGFHGEMAYLERDAAARMGFDAILPFTRSVLAVARAIPGRGITLEIRHFPVEPLLEPRAVALEGDRAGRREDSGGHEPTRTRRLDRSPGKAGGIVRERGRRPARNARGGRPHDTPV